MDLLFRYGINASAEAQALIAEIEYNTLQATNSQYTVVYADNVYINWANGGGDSHPDYMSITPSVPIVNNTIIFENSNWHWIHFYNGSTYLGWYQNKQPNANADFTVYDNKLGDVYGNNIPVPATATHFRVSTRYVTHPYGLAIPITAFQNNPIYSESPSATVTFYDSYPGGNVIGTTNGTQVGGLTDYSLTFVNGNFFDYPAIGSTIDLNTFRTESWTATFHRTNWVPIQDDTINITNFIDTTTLNFANNTTYLGAYTNTSYNFTIGSLSTFNTIPAGATHFLIQDTNQNDFAAFQTITASHGEVTPLSYSLVTSSSIDRITGAIASDNSGWYHTSQINLNGERNLLFNDYRLILYVVVYDSNDNFLGYYYNRQDYSVFAGQITDLGALDSRITLPNDAAYIRIQGYQGTTYHTTTTTEFQNLIVHSFADDYVEINPPGGKKITQSIVIGA